MIKQCLLVCGMGTLIVLSGAAAWGSQVRATPDVPSTRTGWVPTDRTFIKDQHLMLSAMGTTEEEIEGLTEKGINKATPKTKQRRVSKQGFRGPFPRPHFDGMYKLQHPSADPVPQFIRFMNRALLLLGFCDPCEAKDETEEANWVASWLHMDNVGSENGPLTVKTASFGRREDRFWFTEGKRNRYLGRFLPTHIVLFSKEKMEKMEASNSDSQYSYTYLFVPWPEP